MGEVNQNKPRIFLGRAPEHLVDNSTPGVIVVDLGLEPHKASLDEKRYKAGVKLAVAGSLALLDAARADTVITAFDNFSLDGLFPSWATAMITSLPRGYSVTASGFGSGYKALNPSLNAAGETNIELTVTLVGTGRPTTPISGPIVSLEDADGTFYNYAWYGQPQGTQEAKAAFCAFNSSSVALGSDASE